MAGRTSTLTRRSSCVGSPSCFQNRNSSWRQGSRPQAVNQVQDPSEQSSGDGDLRQLECDKAVVAHHLGADLDDLISPRGLQPRNDLPNQPLCPSLARFGPDGHVRFRSVIPPASDISSAMSAFGAISSASPPGADLPGGVAEGPFLTQAV